MTLRLVHQKPWSYDVLIDDAKDIYYLDVVCGSHGIYMVCVLLTDEDVRQYREGGSWLDILARQVSYNPDRFRDRQVDIERGKVLRR